MKMYEDKYFYDKDGEPIELTDLQRVNLICFKCTKYIENDHATLISPYTQKSSDCVAERDTIELCKQCYEEIMVFCGAEPITNTIEGVIKNEVSRMYL